MSLIRTAWPGRIDGTIRPYMATFAYLLGDFTDFHRWGEMLGQVTSPAAGRFSP